MKIRIKDVKAFIQGNTRLALDQLGYLPSHIQEQVAYRAEICKNDCAKQGKCVSCGCAVPGKWYADKSCNNGTRFPDLMDAATWEEYKDNNDIKINFDEPEEDADPQ